MKKSDKRITITVISILLLFFLLFYAGIKSNNNDSGISISDNRIGVVDLKGIILSPYKISEQLQKFQQRDDIKAIILRIDSPGGGVAASHEIYAAVKNVKESGKPILAYIAGTGASGGYYVALGANTILANPTSITGSIGVIINIPRISELMSKIGVDQKVIKSGKFKDIGSPYRELSAEDSLRFQSVIDDLYDQFLNIIVVERGIIKNDLKKIADGRIFTGYQAFDLGLVDTLGTFQDAISVTAKMAGITEKPKLVFSKKKKYTMFDLLFSDIEEVFSLISHFPVIHYL